MITCLKINENVSKEIEMEVNNITSNFVDSFTMNRKERNLTSRRTEHLIQSQTNEAIVIIRIYRHLYFKRTHKIITKKKIQKIHDIS